MGAENLNDFIYRHRKYIVDDINIRDEITKWKGEHDGKMPEILIDLKEFPRMLLQKDKIGIILGGNYDRYNKTMRQFLENLDGNGAKLVFFMPGRQHSDDLQFLIPKTEDVYWSSLEILDKIDEKCDLREYLREKKLYDHMRMELSFDFNLKQLVCGFGHFFVTHEQHNQEIAQYANRNADNVLAVITNQNDFLAFSPPGDYDFWRASTVDPTAMTCHRYNEGKLYDKLGFKNGIVQMQLFSALCRSIFLPKYAIEDFLNRLADANENPLQSGTIWDVSAYVKDQYVSLLNDKAPYNLERISRDVFGSNFSQEQCNAIAKGMAYYRLVFELTPIPELNAFLQRCKIENLFAYKLATDDIFNVKDISYIDFRSYKSKSYAELVVPILMKLCGIVFKDEDPMPSERKICMKHSHDELSKITNEVIIYPTMELPELFDLVFNPSGRQFDQVRYALLEWVLNLKNGTMEKVREKRTHFAAVIITLMYLVQQKELTAKEANIILYTEQQIRNLGFNRTDYPDQPNAHYVRMAHLYVKMYVLISHCLEVCGLQHMTDLLRFDGTIFHNNMEKFERSSQHKLKLAIEPIWMFS